MVRTLAKGTITGTLIFLTLLGVGLFAFRPALELALLFRLPIVYVVAPIFGLFAFEPLDGPPGGVGLILVSAWLELSLIATFVAAIVSWRRSCHPFGRSSTKLRPPSTRVSTQELLLQSPPRDKAGNIIRVGARVRLLCLSGKWLDELPAEEKQDVLSMVGEIFEVEEIDEYGHPWVRKSWPNEKEGKYHSHSIALESHEMELVHDKAL